MEPFAGRLRVLELYSGIGGMHWALKESGVDYDIVQAMDVNTSANKIYQHNFPDISICASSITKLTLAQLTKWAPNTILMSPPCQPFTRVGKKQDCQDPRTESFLHLLDLLRKLDHKPEYILVENVKGFEVSETRQLLLDMLHDCNYTFQEFLLTPLQFGVPNCRMRYYLVAKMKPLELAFWTSQQILESMPVEAVPLLRYRTQQTSVTFASTMRSSEFQNCHHYPFQQAAVKSSSPSQTAVHSRLDAEASVDFSSAAGRLRDGSGDDVSRLDRVNVCDTDCQSEDVTHHLQLGTKQTFSQDSKVEHEESFDSKSISSIAHDFKVKNSVHKDTDSSKTGVEDCVETHKPVDNMSELCPLTIAEAGRNMRHCEEEDVLVCEDGTRLQEYLEKADDEYFHQFLLGDKELRMFVVMDVVHPSFKKSSCFTKRYGHYVEGAGSLVMMTDDVKIVKEASEFKSWAVKHKNRQQWGEQELSVLRCLKLRYFTPREVANLLCFPSQFEFPEEFNTIQCHRVLGNSLNVHVVSVLIQLLLMEPGVI